VDNLLKCTGFDWDDGNTDKNWIKHRVTPSECEQFFFNQPLVVNGDPEHSSDEERSYALGRTNRNRFLFVAFTVRRNLIRVISARDMSRKERKVHGDE
jgi:uncharacterized DUF497 family protein